MTRKERSPALDEAKRREILAILSVGCPRSTAARYVGCAPSTLLQTARRDPEFAEQLRHAENRAELEYMRNIQNAARDPKYWRAAAWVLERRNPSEYGHRPVETLTVAQVGQLLQQLAEFLVPRLPESSLRQQVVKEFDRQVVALLGTESARQEGERDESVDAS